ncbi:MAG TPA: cytochrome c oxidase subunit II [Gemmatimonadaceae bacterium]|jgi:cytochrome c oxidase subunit 2|nr:cytochrome c oxidase subunit II [Gemmatimonadaceae bacterium]
MHRKTHLRQLASVALLTGLALALAGCGSYGSDYPNSTFNHTTEFNAAIDSLWDKLLFWGTLVFVLVEGILLYTIIRFRRRSDADEPKHVHGNTFLEIAWTVAPAIILVFIAIPTVRTIFVTQARAVPNALQVEVVGHQWWWEFRYPQYTQQTAAGRVDTLVTANELYLPIGRTVNFALKTKDVLHSFWIPQLGGKRDLISNHTNYLWFTPDSSLSTNVFNGFCAEYCGASHANMRFRTFVVSPAEFDRWTAHQMTPAALAAPAPAANPVTDTAQRTAGAAAQAASATPPAAAAPVAAQQAAAYAFPVDSVPAYARPATPVPAGLTFPDNVTGDAQRGRELFARSACLGCHAIRGTVAASPIGPNLTHIGSRSTLAAGLYPNDARHLALWIKNARLMKPGAAMPTLGLGQRDPVTGATVSQALGGLNDQQIADLVAYLQALR